MDNLKADHGYTHDSQAVKFFVQVLAEMSAEERRQVLFFATGSPRLPIGGVSLALVEEQCAESICPTRARATAAARVRSPRIHSQGFASCMCVTGLQGMAPPLTVVKKDTECLMPATSYLPSVWHTTALGLPCS